MSATRRPERAAKDELTPGQHLRAELARLGLDQVAVSRATGVSRQSINNIVNDRQPISRAMAGKLGRLTGRSSDYWLHAAYSPAATTAHAAKHGARGAGPSLHGGVLVNHQITRAVKKGIIAIDPFYEGNVQLASIDFTLDAFLVTAEGEEIDISRGQSFTLRSHRTVNVSTKEWIELPQDYVGRVGALTSFAKLGLLSSHGFQISPGFKGHLQFCLFNAGKKNIELRCGMPIISVELMPLSMTPEMAPHPRAALRRQGRRPQ